MNVSINNANDIIATSLQLINPITGQLDDILTTINDRLSGVTGVPPTALSTIQAVAAAIDNNPNYFIDTAAAINLKANIANAYTKTEVDGKSTDLIEVRLQRYTRSMRFH